MARIRVNSSLGTFQKNQDQLSNLSSCQQVAPKPKWLKVPWRGPPPLAICRFSKSLRWGVAIAEAWLSASCRAGVPNPWYRSATCQEPGRTAGGERWASERSFIGRSPSLPFLHYLLNHRSHYCVNHPPHRSHYRLNHHLHPRSMEELSSTKPVPGTKKVGDHCCGEQRRTHTLEPSAG